MKENLLIRAVLDGDAHQYAVLVNRYQRPIFNLLVRMTGSRDAASDLTQETFLKAYENLEKFRLGERFLPWLWTIATNLARDQWRKQQNADAHADRVRQAAENFPEPATAMEARMADYLDARRLTGCLQQLPHEYREALILRYHEGLAMGDIGKALGLSTSGAKMRISRGLEKLRALFRARAFPGRQNNLNTCRDK